MFLKFTAPYILNSDNGREFVNSDIKDLITLWPEVKIMKGKPRHSQNQGPVDRANEDKNNKSMFASWMQDNNTTNRPSGLLFVQFINNREHH